MGVPIVAQGVKNSTSIHEDSGSTLALAQWVKDLACCKLQCRLLQMCLRSGMTVAVAAALIGPLTWNFHMLQVWPLKKKKKRSKYEIPHWNSYCLLLLSMRSNEIGHIDEGSSLSSASLRLPSMALKPEIL